MTLDEPRKSTALGPAHHVYHVVLPEDVNQNLVANAGGIFARIQPDLPQNSRRGHPCALEVAFHRLVYLARRLVLDQPELDRVIPIRVNGLLLHNNAGPGFDHSDWRHGTIDIEDLGHPYFLTYYSVDHSYSASCSASQPPELLTALLMIPAKRLDLDVNTRGQIELHQS